MKKHNFRALALGLPLLGSALVSPAAFAENYGIVYSGGDELGVGNVVEAPELINGLSTLMQHRDVTIAVSNSPKWQTGYIGDNNECVKVHYVEVSDNNPITSSDSLSFVIKKDKYSATVDIKSITTENLTGGKFSSVGVVEGADFVYAGWDIYTDSTCQTEKSSNPDQGIKRANHDRVFVKMNVKLAKNGQPFVHDGIYFGITDIDAGQSYKILNEGNKLVADNMFAKSIADLQDEDPTKPLKNKFVSSGNYIYSEYSDNDTVGSDEKSNIYVPLSTNTQTQGLDLVFGFASGAASGIEYYAKQFNVIYKSDDNGKISGIKNEKVFPNENPSGSSTTPNEGYILSHWEADKDVTLTDGTTIKKGDPISGEQILKVAITSDTTFTAYHVAKPPVPPDTGEVMKKELSGAVVPMSIAGIIALAAVLFYLPRVNHKKVNFKKK